MQHIFIQLPGTTLHEAQTFVACGIIELQTKHIPPQGILCEDKSESGFTKSHLEDKGHLKS